MNAIEALDALAGAKAEAEKLIEGQVRKWKGKFKDWVSVGNRRLYTKMSDHLEPILPGFPVPVLADDTGGKDPKNRGYQALYRPINAISKSAIMELLADIELNNSCSVILIEYGGMANDPRLIKDPVSGAVGIPAILYKGAATKGKGGVVTQITVPTNSQAGKDMIKGYYKKYDKPVPSQIKVNTGHLFWRGLNKGRKIPYLMEVCHLAEAYTKPNGLAGFKSGWQVQVVTVGSSEANESHKQCSKWAHMWHKPDGILIPESERYTYSGPTLCPHKAMGCPCHGPYPGGGIAKPVFLTEERKKKQKITGSGGPATHPDSDPLATGALETARKRRRVGPSP